MIKMKDNSKLYASLEELAALGSPVDLSVAEVEPGSQAAIPTLEIEPIGRESRAFQLKDGGAGYMIYLRITNQTGKGIYPLEIELNTSWGECITDWLDPSKIPLLRRREPDSYYIAYRFPKSLEVAYGEVLNHHLLHRRKLVPRRPLEGYLVATGEPMPADIKHGQRYELDVTITGSDHTEYTQTISYWVDRVVPQRLLVVAKPVVRGGLDGGVMIPESGPTLLSRIAPGSGETGFSGSSLYK